MRSGKNIFQIWCDVGKITPFRVRRVSWHPSRSVGVVRVSDLRKLPSGLYGEAWTRDDWYGETGWYLRGPNGEISISGAGCYQWVKV